MMQKCALLIKRLHVAGPSGRGRIGYEVSVAAGAVYLRGQATREGRP